MPLSVLIASTDQTALDVYRRLFFFCGHEVETASGGVECLTKVREFAPDVLVLDEKLSWGGADGLLARLREDEHGLFMTPVVLLVDGDQPSNGRDLPAAPPVARCLRKPFRFSALLDAVCAASHHREPSQA